MFAAYRRHRVPQKSEAERRSNDRQLELWIRFLGPDKDPLKITLQEWEMFIRSRGSGTIDPRGYPVPSDRQRPVRARSVQKDCAFLAHRYCGGQQSGAHQTDGTCCPRTRCVVSRHLVN